MTGHAWVGEHCTGDPDGGASPTLGVPAGPGRGEEAGGTAETATGPGTLDRLLADAKANLLPSDPSVAHVPDGPHGDRLIAQWRMFEAARDAGHAEAAQDVQEEIGRLRDMVHALYLETEWLAAALEERTHEYEPEMTARWGVEREVCGYVGVGEGHCCVGRDDPVHRTPARGRAEHGTGPT